jgi:N-6 DNA Methylase
VLSRIKFDIDELVNERLDQLPTDTWTSKTTTFLDPAIGGGQFIRAIEQRLRQAGHSDENIAGRVFGCESSKLNVQYAKNKQCDTYKYKLVATLSVGDFLKTDFGNMRFDNVVGNPPYLKGKWIAFLKRSIELSNKHVLMISPDGTNNFSTRSDKLISFLKENGIQSKVECTDSFPTVLSGKIVTYFLDKSKPGNSDIFDPVDDLGRLLKQVVPNSRKSFRGGYEFMEPKVKGIKRNKNKDVLPSNDSQSSEYPQRVIVGVTRKGIIERYFAEQSSESQATELGFVINRSFGQGSNKDVYLVDSQNTQFTNNVIWFEAYPGETVESFLSVFGSNIYGELLTRLRNGSMDIRATHLQALPCPPLTRVYSEQEVDIFLKNQQTYG